MRGIEVEQETLFSYVSVEKRVPESHPLRPIKAMVDAVLSDLSEAFDGMYAERDRPSIPPEQLLRALLLQVLYTVRSERMLMEQLDYNLLFRWFVGLEIDEPVWDATVFTKNRDRLLAAEVAELFFRSVVERARRGGLMSREHFTVDGKLIEAWAGQKSVVPKRRKGSRNPAVNFRGQKRSNRTHASTTDPYARMYRKSKGAETKLGYLGHVLMDNRWGLVVDARVTVANGTAERDAALDMIQSRAGRRRLTLAGGQELRHAGLRGQPLETQRHTTRGAEAAFGLRRADDAARGIPDQSTETKVCRRGLRLDEDGRDDAQDPAPGARPGRLDVHFRRGGLQPGLNTKPDAGARMRRPIQGQRCLSRLSARRATPRNRHESRTE